MAVRTTTRIPMPIKMRAKQFAMFDALKGLTEANGKKEEQYTIKRELMESRIEEINQLLKVLQVGDMVTLCYYCSYGKQYRTIIGKILKVDMFWKEFQVGETVIGFSEIYEIRKTE